MAATRLIERLQAQWTKANARPETFFAGAWAAGLDGGTLLEIRAALEWLQQTGGSATGPSQRIAVVANFVIQGLPAPLELYLRLIGLQPTLTFHPPYRLPESPLEADVVLVLTDFEKFRDHAGTGSAALWSDWLGQLRAHAPAARLLATEPLPLPMRGGVRAEAETRREACFAAEIEAACISAGVTLVRWSRALATLGWARAHRPAHYLHYDQLLAADGNVVAAQMLARYVAAFALPRKKVIALDADNTLWSGIAGEVGAENVVFLPDTPRGRCFHAVLLQLKALSETGILLALVSKNEPDSVRRVLERADFPLKADDFAAMRINWERKSDNLRAIAAELNLGLDSFLFLDDSEPELLEVATVLPEVTGVLVPPIIEEYPALLGTLPGLDRLHLTTEDRERKSEYRRQAARRNLQEQNPADFLARLAVHIEIRAVIADDLPRFAQLLAKTNQFRLTAWKPGEDELRPRLDDPRWRLFAVRYRDVFGDSGVVGAALFEQAPAGWHLRNFALSCRVLGRGVEEALLAEWSRRFAPLIVDFVPSERNQVAERTLHRLGWQMDAALSPTLAPSRITLHHS